MKHIACHPLTFSNLPHPFPLGSITSRCSENEPVLQRAKKVLRTRGVKFLSPGHVLIRYGVHRSRSAPGGEKGVAHKFPLQNSKKWRSHFLKKYFIGLSLLFLQKNYVLTKDSSAITKFIKTFHSFFLSRSSIFSSLESVVCIFTLFLPFQAVFWIMFKRKKGRNDSWNST